jgi:hypothetical protein
LYSLEPRALKAKGSFLVSALLEESDFKPFSFAYSCNAAQQNNGFTPIRLTPSPRRMCAAVIAICRFLQHKLRR